MENTVKQRIKQFIKYKDISVREFERRCNLSNGYINGIKQTIMPNKLSIITLQFPELNDAWLLTGKGEMLHSGDTTPDESIKSEIDQLKTRVSLLEKIILKE